MRTRQLRPPGGKSRGGRQDDDVVSVSTTSSSSGPRGGRTGWLFGSGPAWEATFVMAMFEQMRANVGKLLKGIDRSEPGRRERFWPSGVVDGTF